MMFFLRLSNVRASDLTGLMRQFGNEYLLWQKFDMFQPIAFLASEQSFGWLGGGLAGQERKDYVYELCMAVTAKQFRFRGATVEYII